MNDTVPSSVTSGSAPDGRSVRRLAALGAFAASCVVIAIAAAVGGLGGWLLGAMILGLGGSALALMRKRSRSPAQAFAVRDPSPPSGLAESLLANIPDPVVLVDRRAVVLEMNAAARDLLPGLKLKAPLSFALRSPDVLDGIERVLRSGEPIRVEYSERVPSERTFEVQVGPLRAERPNLNDHRTDVLLFFRDLTSARRLENMRADFVANASHELRTPLASLIGFIDTLQGPARNDPVAREKFLDVMRGQAQRMARLIDNLLSLSRIEMRAHLAPSAMVDIGELVKSIVDLMTPLARERQVEIRWKGPGEPLLVLGDRDELLRVAENLIENGVKYGESGGRVDVTLERFEDAQSGQAMVALSVRDYGPGIEPEHLPRLTERFYRADAAQSREKGGTGLGLAIVKHIVNRHKGQLTIESEPGKGALFKVTLPEKSRRTELDA